MRRIRQIEDFGAELRVQALGDLEGSIDAEVEIVHAGPTQRVISGRSEPRAGHRGEGGRVEVRGWIAKDLPLRLHLVRALVATWQAQRVAGRDTERRSRIDAPQSV